MSDAPISARVSRDAQWVIALGVLVGCCAISLSLTGMLGQLSVASVAACILAAAAVTALYLFRSGGASPPVHAWLALPLLTPTALAALLPPHTWDEVAYGAALPRDFARAGRFFYNSDYGAYAAFPGNYESLVTASLLLTNDVWLNQLLNVVLALGLAVVAVLIARALGSEKPASLVAGLLVLCAPAVIETAPLTKNDVANAFFQALAVLVLLTSRAQHEQHAAGLSGAFLGVSLGTKYSSLHFALALLPLAVLFLANSALTRAQALRRVSWWVMGLAVVGSPWYLRNLGLFSNPVFPFMNDWLRLDNGFTLEHSALLRESFDGLADFSFRTGTTTTFVTRMTNGFGLLPMVLLVPGTLIAMRPPRRSAGALAAGTAIGGVLLTLFAGFWEPRYVLSLLVLSSALAAGALENVARVLDRWGFARIGAMRLTLGTAVVVAVCGGYPSARGHLEKFSASWREGREAFVENRAPYYAVARWLNAHMGPDDRVAIGFNVQPFYYLERSYYHIHPLTQGELVSARTPEEVEAALRRTGATFLAFSGSDGTYFENTAPRISAYRERLWMAQRRLRQAGRLRLVTTISGVRILRLDAEGPAVAPRGSEPRDR